MPSYIHTIETSLPEFKYSQDDLRERMKEIVEGTERDKRILHQIYARSGIDTRYSVVEDFKSAGSRKLYFNGQGAYPGTKSRNDLYIAEGRKLFTATARKLLENSRFNAKEITHLVTISCTGFYAPGPDYDIIKNLGLQAETERYHLGFMGCYAAIPGLKLAKRICDADPGVTVMVISAELCTLHFQANNVPDNMVSASVFADGAAGAIISSQKPEEKGFKIEDFASAITEKGSEDMAWEIGDSGFNMVLSSYVPALLGDGLEPFLNPVLSKYGITQNEIDLWGVHPGGRAILDKIEQTLSLDPALLDASRKVLANYGNMSSATVLFVLKELLNQPSEKEKETALAMAFGPGLTIESALLTKFSG